MALFSKPGALTMYTTSERHGLPLSSDCPAEVGPASYDLKPSIRLLKEIVAPFHTSEVREENKPNGNPSPCEYNPWQRPRNEFGTPMFGVQGDRFPEDRHCSLGPGPTHKLPDPWVKKISEIYHAGNTKRPRVKYEKFVSNNVPSVFNPHDMQSFVQGVDGRMYPWWKNRIGKIPGPKYNVEKIYTSKSPGPRTINFGRMAARRPLFPDIPGFGPADFNIRLPLKQNGGIFLSETSNDYESMPRLFDTLVIRSAKETYPTPLHYTLSSDFDKASPKAIMAPFKSKVPTLGFKKKPEGPGPSDHFKQTMTIDDIYPPVFPYSQTCPPDKPPFNNSEERFFDMAFIEQFQRPDPAEYNIKGFTDIMLYNEVRHAPAVRNPKLGFLTSAPARSTAKFSSTETLSAITHLDEPSSPRREWRNIRPRNACTYSYYGAPLRGPESPGPKYDTTPAIKAIKGQRSWWNPREFTGTGFNNSGCGRKINLSTIDKDNPGPMYELKSFIPGPGGLVNRTEPRFKSPPDFGPGPRHKAHEKAESVWRATQLGTYNVYLKGIGGLHPNSGGFHPHGPIDRIADSIQGFDRIDDYRDDLAPRDNISKLNS